MKNKILIFLFSIFFLVGCEHIEQPPMTPPSIIETETPEITETVVPTDNPTNGDENKTPIYEEVEFVVSLVYNKKIFIPEEEITVIWMDDYSQYTQKIDSEGYAKIKLDGDFNVILSKTPEGYTYNPNIYTASNDEPIN